MTKLKWDRPPERWSSTDWPRGKLRRERFQRAIPHLVRRGRASEALLGAWAAQGRMPPTRGGRMQRQRDRRVERAIVARGVERYTRAADQARVARNAMARTMEPVKARSA